METAAMNARLEEEKIDITLPGRAPKTGHIHPLTDVYKRQIYIKV